MQTNQSHFTVGQVSELYDAPGWRIRRIVDALGVTIPRAGQYRLIPREHLPQIGAELRRLTGGDREASPCL